MFIKDRAGAACCGWTRPVGPGEETVSVLLGGLSPQAVSRVLGSNPGCSGHFSSQEPPRAAAEVLQAEHDNLMSRYDQNRVQESKVCSLDVSFKEQGQ